MQEIDRVSEMALERVAVKYGAPTVEIPSRELA
jgi:hypothetical protein